MKKQNKLSLKENIILLILLGWVIPVLTLAVLLATFVDKRVQNQVDRTVYTSLDKATELFDIEMGACETASKNASYYSDIRDAYLTYLRDANFRVYKSKVEHFLNSEYKYNKIVKSAMITFNDDNTFYTYNNSSSAGFKNVEYYLDKAYPIIAEIAENIGTATKLVDVDGHIYMVRNMMLQNFKPYAVLSIEINESSLCRGYESVWGYTDMVLLLDGEYMVGNQFLLDSPDYKKYLTLEKFNRSIYEADDIKSFASSRMLRYGSEISAVIVLSNEILHQNMYTTWVIFGLMLIFMIPLIAIFFLFFRYHLTKPIDKMLDAYEQISEQQYGYQIEQFASSKEFYSMQESFNKMSYQLREQFEKIYLEEIALRDARIMALQSQINPHFLNNTFEIINWEARLNGNIKVSKMIEALSTMLEATMNRKGENLHSLAKEMSYVDAYAYIISERLGDKFDYKKEIDEGLMSVEIPRLIIQPIVENAVEHGIGDVGRGNITIKIRKNEEDYICIEIWNDGILRNEDKEKIAKLLKDNSDGSRDDSLSLGIRNVNRRLKLIYGEDCGLSIVGEGELTVSTILIKNKPILAQY